MEAKYMGSIIKKTKKGFMVNGKTYLSLVAATTAVEKIPYECDPRYQR